VPPVRDVQLTGRQDAIPPYLSSHYSLSFVTGPIALLGVMLLQRGNAIDPVWSQVYRRSLLLQDYYPARASMWAKIQTGWPGGL
jgi:hypothetical protein